MNSSSNSNPLGNFKLDGRTIAIGVLVILAAIVFLPRILGGGNNTTPDVNSSPEGGNDTVLNDNIVLGAPVTSRSVDSSGCPVQTTDDFDVSDDIYVVAPNSRIPADTSVFVRLYHNDSPVEDAPEIVADRNYDSTCINFVFEPANGSFDAGSYEAEFFVNGNPADTIRFEVR